MFNKNKLGEEQINCLFKLDFKFSVREQPAGWDVRYAELIEYARENENTNVPSGYEKKLALVRWVCRQRTTFRQNKLAKEQINRLRKIDFKFSVREKKVVWDVRYAELVEYKK